MRFVVDNSVVQRLSKPVVLASISAVRSEHELLICTPTLLEVGVSAKNVDHFVLQLHHLADTMVVLEASPEVNVQALSIQRKLVEKGQHRGPGPVDILVAAHAVVANARVLHYDRDFELMDEHAGVPQTWILPRGTTA